MKVAQNDETIPDTQPVRPSHTPNISNSQLSPSVPLPENTQPRAYFPGCFPPFTGITYYRVRAHRTPRIALLYFVMLCLLCIHYFFPLFSPVDYETDAAADQFDYGVDDPSFLPEQPCKPPMITRYRLFSSILLALE